MFAGRFPLRSISRDLPGNNTVVGERLCKLIGVPPANRHNTMATPDIMASQFQADPARAACDENITCRCTHRVSMAMERWDAVCEVDPSPFR